MSKTIVLSGVNMVEGGILTIFKDTIDSFSTAFNDCQIICLVHDKDLFPVQQAIKNVKFIEFRTIKKGWLRRIYFEYIYSYFLSRRLKPIFWFCLHDMSAYLYKTKQYVYCHNPSPFYKAGYDEWRLDKKFFLFTKFYSLLYKINIKSNSKIIVQQRWIADNFSEWFGVNNLIVSKPVGENNDSQIFRESQRVGQKIRFLYPAVPRVFKNFEVLLDAIKYIKKNEPKIYSCIVVNLTFGEGFNKCGDDFIQKCLRNNVDVIKFIGFKSKDKLFSIYENETDCILFPSRLETWGLPLSEAKKFGLPIIAADLPYAKETVDKYKWVKYFDPLNAEQLAKAIVSFVAKEIIFDDLSIPDDSEWDTCYHWNDLADVISKEIYSIGKN